MRGGNESGEFQWAVKESDDRRRGGGGRVGRRIRARCSLLPLRSSHCGRLSRASRFRSVASDSGAADSPILSSAALTSSSSCHGCLLPPRARAGPDRTGLASAFSLGKENGGRMRKGTKKAA